jgi:hypothetical protein
MCHAIYFTAGTMSVTTLVSPARIVTLEADRARSFVTT